MGGCAREGDGGAVSSAAERHRAADRAEEPPGLAIVGRGARGARGVRGAAVSGGARTPLGGDESRRSSCTEANPGGGGGERHAVPSRPNRTGTGPAGGIPGGRAGLGTGAPGPGSLVVVGRRGGDRAGLWAAAGEGGRGRAGRARGRTPRGPRGLGEGSRGRPFLEGGGAGGCSVPGLRRGAAWCGAGAQPCGAAQGRSSVGPRRGAACGRAGVWRRAAEERGSEPRMGAAWARRGAAQGCSAGPRMGTAWGRAGAQ